MAKKHRVFGYQELMNALDGANRKELISGVLVMAIDSWREKELNHWAMAAILNKAVVCVKALGGISA